MGSPSGLPKELGPWVGSWAPTGAVVGPWVVVFTLDFPYLSDLGFLMTVKTKLVRRCELTASCRREMITSRPSPRCPQIETKELSWLPQMSGDSGGPSRLFLPSRTTHPTTGQSPLTALGPSGPEAQPSLPAAPRPHGWVGALPASLPQRHPSALPWCSSEGIAVLSPRLPEARGAGQGDSWTLGGLGPWEDPRNQAVGPWRVGVVRGAGGGPRNLHS